MLAIVGLPSLLFSILILFTPESPTFLLLHRNDLAGAKKILSLVDGEADLTIKRILENKTKSLQRENIFTSKYFRPLLLAFLFSFFNQLSGINAVLYYAPRIFEKAHLDKSSALLQSAGIGVANLIFTLLGWYLIDRVGRKILMYIGSFGYIVSLSLIAYSFYSSSFEWVPIYIFAFIAAHAIGQGSVIWVFISEIFPNSVRASGMAWGSLTHWILAALITNFFPIFTGLFGETYIFAFFALMMIGQLLYVKLLMPETKGATLEDIENNIILH
jgi:MFS family permease